LVLCGADDIDAVWAAVALREVTGGPVEIVMPEELATRVRWRHTVDGSSRRTSLAIGDRLDIADEQIAGVLNRLTVVRESMFPSLPERDRDYAAEEVTALLCAWLLSLPDPVFNRPSPGALVDYRRPAEWRLLAATAGLAAAPWRRSTAVADDLEPPVVHAALVVGERVVGDVPASISEGLLRLSAATGVELFEASFTDEWVLTAVELFPPLRSWGLDAVRALAAAATAGSRP